MSVFTEVPRVAQGRHSYVIADTHPLSEGHRLVCPRREVTRLDELAEDEAADLWRMVRAVKNTALSRGGCTGVRLMVNEGLIENGGPQHIAHLHVHVIPWYTGMRP